MVDLIEVKNSTQRCCKTVYPNEAYGSFKGHQCSRWGKFEHNGKFYCKQHHPLTKKARDDAWNKKFEDDWARRKHSNAINDFRYTAIDVLEKIANGDNDPRTTAQEFFDELQRLKDLPIENYMRK